MRCDNYDLPRQARDRHKKNKTTVSQNRVTRGYDNAHLLADLERKLPLCLLAARCVDPAGDATALGCPLDEAHVSHHERTYMHKGE